MTDARTLAFGLTTVWLLTWVLARACRKAYEDSAAHKLSAMSVDDLASSAQGSGWVWLSLVFYFASWACALTLAGMLVWAFYGWLFGVVVR